MKTIAQYIVEEAQSMNDVKALVSKYNSSSNLHPETKEYIRLKALDNGATYIERDKLADDATSTPEYEAIKNAIANHETIRIQVPSDIEGDGTLHAYSFVFKFKSFVRCVHQNVRFYSILKLNRKKVYVKGMTIAISKYKVNGNEIIVEKFEVEK